MSLNFGLNYSLNGTLDSDLLNVFPGQGDLGIIAQINWDTLDTKWELITEVWEGLA